MRRLRAHTYNVLITLRDDASGTDVEFELRQVARGTRSLWYGATSDGHRNERLFILNTNASTESSRASEIIVERDGLCWVARFEWNERRRRAVHDSGFRFCPIEKRWYTRDPRAAATFDPALREELDRQEEALRETRVPERRAIFSSRR